VPAEELRHPGATLSESTHGKAVDDEYVEYPQNLWEYRPTNQLQRMSHDEPAESIRARRGPKGGDNFRRCLRRQPALPVAYSSESADVMLRDKVGSSARGASWRREAAACRVSGQRLPGSSGLDRDRHRHRRHGEAGRALCQRLVGASHACGALPDRPGLRQRVHRF
jgi:hypothetical protein